MTHDHLHPRHARVPRATVPTGCTGFIALILLSLGVVGYAIAVYGLLPLGAAVHPDMRATFMVASGASMDIAYPVVAWLCWVPNVLMAELLFNKAHNRGVQPTPASGRG